MKISKGDVIFIENIKYDVLSVVQEGIFVNGKKEIMEECIEAELHKFGESTLRPTHLLRIYKDKSRGAFLMNLAGNNKKMISFDKLRIE